MSIEGWKSLPLWVRVVLSSIAAFLMSISAISAGLVTIEPWIPTHRQMTRDLIAEETIRSKLALEKHAADTLRTIAPTKIGMYDIQISIARSRRSDLTTQIFRAEIDTPKSDSTDELVKRRQQLQTMRDELASLDTEIKLLRDQRERN